MPWPEHLWGTLSHHTIATLDRLGVRRVSVVNRVSPHYPIANKIDCLAIESDRAGLVFVDSDMLVMRPPDLRSLRTVAIGAVPASLSPASSQDWARCYTACGLETPEANMRTLLSDEWTRPYFNAGFVFCVAAMAGELADEWADCARRVRALNDLPTVLRDRFLDQIALPIAAARLGTAITPLPVEWNFPSWGMPLAGASLPAFYHYQNMAKLMGDPITSSTLMEFVATDAGVGHAVLAASRTA